MELELDNIRTLEEICKKNKLCFQINILGNVYCILSINKKINCNYLWEKDKNGLYPCKLNRSGLKLSIN